MSIRRVVVDGSNIATEGRALPSLSQLRDAVAAWKAENPDDEVTVVVDASFSYRIDDAERAEFEAARTTGELVSPPAGAIGRGDGFLLQIADRTDAIVLSNDSFQEYHGEYSWLFERGRLIGGTPVPGVGWIFSVRTPVRGPRSREAIKEAKKKVRGSSKAKPIEEAIAEATEDVLEPDGAANGESGKKRRRRRRVGGSPPPETVNDPAPFIRFITTYKLGSTVEGVVDRFSSHGAFVTVDETTCYVPLTAMGTPPPRAAREVMRKGERRPFVVQALDAQRRGVELALPGFERIGGGPTEETVEAEIREERSRARKKAAGKKTAAAARAVEAPAAATTPSASGPGPDADAPEPPRKRGPRRRSDQRGDSAAPAADAPARAASGGRPSTRTGTAGGRRRAAGRGASTGAADGAARTEATRKAAAASQPAPEKASAATAAAKEAAVASRAAKKAAAKKTSATQPAAKKPAAKKPAAKKKAAAEKATAKKATAKKATARNATAAKEAATKQAAAKQAATKGTAKNAATKKQAAAKKQATAKKA